MTLSTNEEIFIKSTPLDKSKYLAQIKAQIQKKRLLIWNTADRLQNNRYLSNLKTTNNKYKQHIIDQQKEQIQAFNKLNDYISDIMKVEENSEDNLQHLKQEHQFVESEIQELNNNLSNLTNLTNE